MTSHPILDAVRSFTAADIPAAVGDQLVALRGEPDACWLWTGPVNGKGYGYLHCGDFGRQGVHRLAWILANGEIPAGLHVLHRCDTPACINPSHLWTATNAENHADKILKGRQNSLIGEDSGRAILTEREATAIHRLIALGLSEDDLSAAFGISRSTVHRIKDGSRWPHVAKAEAYQPITRQTVIRPVGPVLTTGEAAAMCGVSSRTVTKWCDQGDLKSHRVPGSTHRRVLRTDLQAFADANGMMLQPAVQVSQRTA